MFKKILIGLVTLLVAFSIWQCELILYGIMQGQGQVKVVLGSRPIEEFLNDPTFPDSIKYKLKFVQEVRQFSIDYLGITDSDNYKTLYNQNGQVSLWNLTACEPFELKAKDWSFPVIGSFPYKGFFDLEKAKKARDELGEKGYDTRISPVSGWSTLGWFNDPILSNMLNRPEGALSKLIIHELTHGTLYIKDSTDYNENLATFIGEKGAEQFLNWKYGPDSNQLKEYKEKERDSNKYIDHFIRGAKGLDSLYGTMNASLSAEVKSKMKNEMIQGIVDNIDTIQFYNGGNYKKRFEKSLPNNAYFMSFLRYHSKQGDFERDFQENYNGDVRTYLTYLKQKYPSL